MGRVNELIFDILYATKTPKLKFDPDATLEPVRKKLFCGRALLIVTNEINPSEIFCGSFPEY